VSQITPVDKNGRIIHQGMRVRIPSGTVITGTFEGGEKLAERTYTITVIAADEGYEATNDHFGNTPATAPRVCWAGSGGFWHYADAEAVEIV
jgi:hypothetical protein